ncbi:MAG TPA: cytochrome P450 [Chloroflexaceae bacterium]|nr:cytochrome P450 [Chloroflexaceae bacterium]
MATPVALSRTTIKHPIDISSGAFIQDKYAYYRWLREEAPVYKGKLSIISVYLLSRYDDCVAMLKDSRFVRDRTTVTGGKNRLPIPVPKAISLVAQNMILEDEPEHRRLRNLVHKAFTPRALARLEGRIERLTHDLLDAAGSQDTVDLMQAYALPIPVTVIKELVGVSDADMPRFRGGIRVLSEGFTGWNFLRTIVWDLPATVRFVRGLIARKRADPGDDILTGLIQAEEAGQQLSDDELVSMVMLLILAGYETTVHLITNSVVSLLLHPEQLARLRAEPELAGSAVEEVLRYNGPVQNTKPAYAVEDVTLHGVTIPKGAMVMPLIGSANHDPASFEQPQLFDIARTPNRHLGFGHGIHYCLGAPLARMETRIALTTLLARSRNLRLAVAPEQLALQPVPSWHRYAALPVVLA